MNTGRGAGQATLTARQLYQRFRQLIHEGAKFGVVGGIGVVVVLAGSDALHFELGLGKFTSVTIATVFATVVTFLGNRYWSFRHRQGAGPRNETILFFILNGVGLLIQYACIFLVTDLIGLSGRLWYTIANLVGIGIGTLFRFWSYRKWIWVHPEVALAKLRRGRHRKGRTTPVPPAPSARPGPHPQTAPLAKRQVRQPGPRSGPAYDGPAYNGPAYNGPAYNGPAYNSPVHPSYPMHPEHSGHPAYPATPGVHPLLAATHSPAPAPAPTADDPDRWLS